jgi:hypothetical protein
MSTHLLIPQAALCVPESQASEYQKRLEHDRSPAQVVTHPDTVKGLTPKLNWCLDRYRDEEAIIFVDDDITTIQRTFVEPGEDSIIRDPAQVLEIIEHTHQLALDMGVMFFGWEANNGAIRYHDGLKPFQMTGYINGCAMGFRRGHGLRFDERVVAKNDFDISAMNAFKHRRILRNNRYLFCQKATFVGKGGQAAFRNSDTERRDVELLRRKWGPIFHFGAQSGTRKRDYAGVQKITMHLPF